jgi:CBS domain-containing protein
MTKFLKYTLLFTFACALVNILLSDDWMLDSGFADETFIKSIEKESSKWKGATVADLKLATPITILGTDKIEKALDIMRRRGFDQLPVINDKKRYVPPLVPPLFLSDYHILVRLVF